MAEQLPFISIIVPVKNAERTLDTTFTYLLNVDYPRDKMEIVIADGGSTDGTVGVIRKWQEQHAFITYVEVPNCPSPGFARNKAIEKAKGEYLLFTDGDCAPEKDWAKLLVEPFLKDAAIGGVGGEVYTLRTDPENITESYCEQVGFLSLNGRYPRMKDAGYMPVLTDMSPSEVSGHNAPFFATANAAYSKKAISAVGGFWSHPTGEDVEFSVQVQLKGFKLYYQPKSVVKHMHRTTLEAFNRVWIGYGKGHPFLVEKLGAPMKEIVLQCMPGSPSIKIPSKKKMLVYLGAFQMMHIFGALTIIFLLLSAGLLSKGLGVVTLVSALMTLYFMNGFFGPLKKLQPKDKFLYWCKVKYQTNLHFIKGGLMTRKQAGGILYIEPSF